MNALYLFVILLLLTTVISSFGGALRVEENFYNEVFDLTDEKDAEPLVKPAEEEPKPKEEPTVDEPEGNDEDAITQAPIEAAEETPTTAPVNETEIVEEEMVEQDVNAYQIDDQYAAF